ncbi:39S ribosomal protein L52, mitochondrial [Syngnathoides biaculeatus]|uniref:39S ribosomal protein L52, mitochondrial n=1 Tax=Syngnathoides biaculeatus TaxID=300417 RepID=UPI002ADDC3FE|nr:39S ribosomal protein L52, mitochondrial [Syngnathoides biaculeatus]XP_061664756.1 39S ribosomal protein L52, mitochondrial [Syngnathoides biaculeatus]XP_061664757.1 39S ribosomal protein L52, mitochondrial [Syngnathoides biaculeatus]
MAAPLRALCFPALKHCGRRLSTTTGAQAGEKWRKEHGLARSGTEYGPLTDLPDWSFADGRPAPPMKGTLRRRREREELARRIVMLDSEIDRGIESCRERDEEAQRLRERQKSLLLKPKGHLLKKKKKKKEEEEEPHS